MLSPLRQLPLLGLALVLSGLGSASTLDLSDLEAAEAELEEVVIEWQQARKSDLSADAALDHALALQALGTIERDAAKPKEALGHLEEACELLTDHAPDQLPGALEAKALTLQDLARLKESEALLRQVLASREANKSEPFDPRLAATLDHLALNLLTQGRYAEVGPLLEQALDTLGDDHPAAKARLLDHQGRLLLTLENHTRAIEKFNEALKLPFEDPELRLTLESQIALAWLQLGDDEAARKGLEAVAEGIVELFPDSPLKWVPYLNNLGELDLRNGRYEDARASFQSALDILEEHLGPEHPSLIGLLNNLGVTEQFIGDYAKARELLERAAALQAEHLPPTHLRVAETRRNIARNALLAKSPDAREQVELATSLGLGLLDELIVNGSERERLNFLQRFDLLSLPCAIGDPEMIADVLLASKGRLLDVMLGTADEANRTRWRDIQSSLESGTAFIDTCSFFTIETASTEQFGAILILPEGLPHWIPLASAEELRIWLDAFRNRLNWRSASLNGDAGRPPALKLRGILRSLYKSFWQPIGDQIPKETRHLAYSPSGSLHFLPLAALLDEQNQPLCSRYLQVATLSSGRDLLGRPVDPDLRSKPWAVFTISNFPTSKAPDDGDELSLLLSELGPMPGTKEEAERLRAIAPPESIFHHGKMATESSLRNLASPPSVLHFGCHAFFLTGPETERRGPLDFHAKEGRSLLYSGGLVLYRGAEQGIQRRSSEESDDSDMDDLLYPSEIAKLPLQETRLVTLSSCESGAGTPVSGEGLLGLRRGFSLAGVREVVVALWPVSDKTTPTFMDHFYRRAISSGRPAQALWQAQNAFLSAADSDEDFELAVLRYAPFVLSQNSPLSTGEAISEIEVPEYRRFNWLYLLVALPLIIFVLARIIGRRPG